MKTTTKEKKNEQEERKKETNRLSNYCWLLQVLKQHGRNPMFIGNDAEVLENYIRKVTPVTPALDNRLIIIE